MSYLSYVVLFLLHLYLIPFLCCIFTCSNSIISNLICRQVTASLEHRTVFKMFPYFFFKWGDLYFLLMPHFSWVVLRSHLLGTLESGRWVMRAFCTLGIIAFQEKVLDRGAWWATVQEVTRSQTGKSYERLHFYCSRWDPELQSFSPDIGTADGWYQALTTLSLCFYYLIL